MTNRTKTHPLNVSYLVVGLVFLGLAGSWALHESGLVVLDDAQWLLPLTLVAAGVVGLVAVAAKSVRRTAEPEHGAATDEIDRPIPYESPYPNPEENR